MSFLHWNYNHFIQNVSFMYHKNFQILWSDWLNASFLLLPFIRVDLSRNVTYFTFINPHINTKLFVFKHLYIIWIYEVLATGSTVWWRKLWIFKALLSIHLNELLLFPGSIPWIITGDKVSRSLLLENL